MKKKIEQILLKIHEKMTVVLLSLIYFVILGPTAILLRLMRHKKLPVETFNNGSSWINVAKPNKERADYLKQF